MKFKGFSKIYLSKINKKRKKYIYLLLSIINSDEIHLGYVSPLGNKLFVRILSVGVADLTPDDSDFLSVMVV